MAHDAQLISAGGAVAAARVAAAGLATRLRLLARSIGSTIATVRPGFSRSERALLACAKLSGAVPVTLATFAVVEGVPQGIEHLNIALIAVLVSAGLQGPIVHSLADRIWAGEREHRHALRRSPTTELEVS